MIEKRNISINFLVVIFFLLCTVSDAFSQEYYEGELYYKINYFDVSSEGKLSEQILIKEMGDSLSVYIKEDKFAMIHNTKGKLGAKRTVFLLNEGFGYVDFEKSDTILKINLNEESGKLLRFDKSRDDKRVVLGNLCESLTIEFESIDKKDLFRKHTGKYYYTSEKYRLNPKFYINYKSNFWNLYVQESGAISLRNEIEYFPLFRFVQEAYASVKRKLPDSIFEINEKKYIKLIE